MFSSILGNFVAVLLMFFFESQPPDYYVTVIDCLTAVNTTAGSAALRNIAVVYETLGKFLFDLNLLSEVQFNPFKCDILT